MFGVLEHQRFRGFGIRRRIDVARTADHVLARCGVRDERRDRVPMLENEPVGVGVEEVHRDPLRFAVVEGLVRAAEHPATVIERADDLDVALRVSRDKGLEERKKALDADTKQPTAARTPSTFYLR